MTTVSSTGNVWPNYAEGNIPKAGTSDKSMGKDQFMKLLIAQLANQDPMQPMDDKEFISQMAQFSSVEQIMNMSTQLSAMQQTLAMNSDMIGKKISWTSVDQQTGDSSVKSGVVDAIISKDGEQYAKVGSDEIKMTDIASISIPEATS